MVAFDKSDRLVRTTGIASETSSRSVTPNVTAPLNWLTDATMLFMVDTTSARPPPSCGLSCRNTAGTATSGTPSR